MITYKKIYFVGCMTVTFFAAMAISTSIREHSQLDIQFITFDSIQEINDLEAFLFCPVIAQRIAEKKESIQRSIRQAKRLEEGAVFQAWLQKSYFISVARKDSKIHGVAIAVENGGKLWLRVVIVDKQYQSNGIEEVLLQVIHEKSQLNVIECGENSYNQDWCALLQGLGFLLENRIDCMTKPTNDFSTYPEQQGLQAYTIQPIDKNNEDEVDAFFKVLDEKDIHAVLDESDSTWAKGHLASPGSYALGAQDQFGNPVGVALYFDLKNTDSYRVELLAVLPEYQRNGIGKALIQAVQKHAFDAGVKTLEICVLEGNAKAFNCYKSVGFTEQYKKFRMKKYFTK